MTDKKASLDCHYRYDPYLGYLKIGVLPDRVFQVQVLASDDLLFRLIASVCAFATAVNQHNPGVEVHINTEFKVPRLLTETVSEFNRLQEAVRLTYTNVAETYEQVEVLAPFERIHLLSGGKDSARKLIDLAERHGKGHVWVLYVKGTTVNSEYLDEFEAVRAICRALSVRYFTLNVLHGDYGTRAMKVPNRATWREMLLVCLARFYSTSISLGVTFDRGLNSDLESLRRCDAAAWNFAISNYCLDAFAEMLGAKIEIAPSEVDNYRAMREQYPDILRLTRSCYNSRTSCDPGRDWDNACSKCRTLHVYDKILDRRTLNQRELNFVRSNRWVGDTHVRDRYL